MLLSYFDLQVLFLSEWEFRRQLLNLQNVLHNRETRIECF